MEQKHNIFCLTWSERKEAVPLKFKFLLASAPPRCDEAVQLQPLSPLVCPFQIYRGNIDFASFMGNPLRDGTFCRIARAYLELDGGLRVNMRAARVPWKTQMYV